MRAFIERELALSLGNLTGFLSRKNSLVVCCLASWLDSWLAGFFTARLVAWFAGWLAAFAGYQLAGWLTAWLTGLLAVGLGDLVSLRASLIVLHCVFLMSDMFDQQQQL